MVIKVKKTPTNEELIGMLQRDFCRDYTYKQFGLGKKSILVRKSALLGVQITVRENEISVNASPPSIGTGILSALAMTEFAVVILPLFALAGAYPSKFKKLEKDLAIFINEKCN